MDSSIKTESTEKDIIKIRENYEDDYWAKKYGVTADELKKQGNNVGIYNKIVEANFKNKVFNF